VIIKIGQYEVLIDDEDFERVEIINWQPHSRNGKIYFRKSKYLGEGKRITIMLHRLIANAPKGKEVDHISGDTLDNRRSNLRVCTHAENTKNRKGNVGNVTKYKGVHFRKDRKKWTAQIRVNYKIHFLGYFDTPEEAHAAYCEASKKYHGQFGRTK
jgi:hypothetical protein